MELIELYNQIQNPLDDSKVIDKLIEMYADVDSHRPFYNKLLSTVKKEYNRGQYYISDRDRLYSLLFNKWKNSIVSLPYNAFVKLYQKGSYKEDFIKLRKYLMKIPDVSTKKEADDILSGSTNDKELDDAIYNYAWNSIGRYDTWVHICSRYLTAKQDAYPNVEHRLYLNTESFDTYKMATLFIEKCDKYHLPYYFKLDEYADRDDTIVIYSSIENLLKYLDILKEIKNEHQDLVSRVKEPALLTGKIDGWIGYGSEPGLLADGSKTSFNKVRSIALPESINKATKDWVMNNLNKQIKYHGQQITIKDLIILNTVDRLLFNLEKKYKAHESNDQNVAKRDGVAYNPSIVNNRLGYTLNDLRNPQFKQNIYNFIKNKMSNSISTVCNGNPKDMQDIIMTVRNGKKIEITGYDISSVIAKLSLSIYKNDPNFKNEVISSIKNSAKKHGIDGDKYCFDLIRVEKMKMLSTHRETSKIKPISQIDNKNVEEIVEKPKEININALDAKTFLNILNPALLQREMKLPNGTLVPASQYISEIVYPHLPKNGVVILNNGATISVKQFVEECVMFECQEKYNGDFARYMAEKTKNNLGVITINGDSKINAVDITNYINPSLLSKMLSLPNGVQIPAKQYIEEIYVPYIPINGKVILHTGTEISVKQFIEEQLLWEGQEKYNGDINKILYNLTKNNNGIINGDSQKAILDMRNQTESVSQGL